MTNKKKKEVLTKKCAACGDTLKEAKERGWKLKKCPYCKNYFCEVCLIDGWGCPECSDICYI